jgi:hypothetical protein
VLQVRSRSTPTFVVELPGPLSFAFEAAHEAQAVAFADASWFTQALGDYLQSKPAGLSERDYVPRIRSATKEEISIYQDFAREFADMTDCLLFAPVS